MYGCYVNKDLQVEAMEAEGLEVASVNRSKNNAHQAQ